MAVSTLVWSSRDFPAPLIHQLLPPTPIFPTSCPLISPPSCTLFSATSGSPRTTGESDRAWFQPLVQWVELGDYIPSLPGPPGSQIRHGSGYLPHEQPQNLNTTPQRHNATTPHGTIRICLLCAIYFARTVRPISSSSGIYSHLP